MSPRPDSLYVHLPFCTSFCPYCDFPKVFYQKDRIDAYLFSLIKEAKTLPLRRYKTIYVGGGTPTCLEEEKLDRLLSFLSSYLDKDGEFSLESNPENITPDKVDILYKNGVNRVSIGAQSSHLHHLKALGRHHNFEDVKAAVTLLKEKGIDNINLDLMYALPNETLTEAKVDALAFSSLPLTHISAYSLIIEENSRFGHLHIPEAPQEIQADQYEAIMEILEERGFLRYEVSNFAKAGYRCRHNLTYWHDEDYDAIGLGASGHLGATRFRNTDIFSDYIQGKYRAETEVGEEVDQKETFLLSNLRLEGGFALETWKKRFGSDFLHEKEEAISSLLNKGLVEIKDGRFKATRGGLLLLDTILISLF